MNDAAAPNRIRELRDKLGLSAAGLGKLVGMSQPQVHRLERGERRLKSDQVEAFARALGVRVQDIFPTRPTGGLQEQIAEFKLEPELLPPSNVRLAADKPPLPERHTMPRDVPVYGTAAGGNGDGCFELNQGEPIDFVRRGPGIEMARDVYCIYVEGESMVPWKEPGDMIYLDPARKVRVGDYVVLVVDGPSRGEPPRAYLKRLVRRGPEQTTFLQYNPAKDVVFDTRLIKSMTRVLTMEEVLGV